MQLRYKKNITLKKATYQRQDNGSKLAKYENIDSYIVQQQEITDELSATIYGSDINSMLRMTSIKNNLEKFLKEKINNSEDNISNYFIEMDNKLYKVVSAKSEYVDIKVVES